MYRKQMDYGKNPFIADIEQIAMENENFRTAIWTGTYAQMTLMCIPPCEDIGMERHEDTDQILLIQQGNATVVMGKNQCRMEVQERVSKGDVIIVPAGTWHNVINTGRVPLKLASVYAPPKHPKGTIHHTKKDAEHEY